MNPTGPTIDLAFVVATKDRRVDLCTLLESLAAQSRPVRQIVIVDASSEPVDSVVGEYPQLRITYLRHLPPSAATQRNVGVAAVEETIGLIGFFDDDIVLEPDAIEKMAAFWAEAPAEVGGASFNIMNPTPTGGRWLKRSRLCTALGLYRPHTGQVAPSGWQTVMDTVENTCCVDWLPTTAVVWRRDVFRKAHFDDFFEGYSYLEDLDFSFGLGKLYKLAVVSDARYRHYPSLRGRIDLYKFGRIELTNRLYFVRKHGLSVLRCYLGLGIRLLLTLLDFCRGGKITSLQRACGNLRELARNLWLDLIPRS